MSAKVPPPIARSRTRAFASASPLAPAPIIRQRASARVALQASHPFDPLDGFSSGAVSRRLAKATLLVLALGALSAGFGCTGEESPRLPPLRGAGGGAGQGAKAQQPGLAGSAGLGSSRASSGGGLSTGGASAGTTLGVSGGTLGGTAATGGGMSSTGSAATSGGSATGGVATGGGNTLVGGSSGAAKAAGGTPSGGQATGGKATGSTASGGGPTGGASTGGALASGGTTSTGGSITAGGASSDGCSGGLASAITLSKIAFYQAVEATVMQNGTAVAAASRNADVVQGRPAMARIFVTPATGWASREVAVRMHVITGGVDTTVSVRKQITAASLASDLASTANLEIAKEILAADTRYWVEIVECGTGQGTVASPRFPASGDTALEARATGPVKIAFVPVTVGSYVPDTSATALATYANYVMAMYPVTTVTTSVTTGGVTATSPVNWTTLLDQIRAKRSADKPAADVYYYGLVKPAATMRDYCGTSCVAGIGYVSGTSSTSASTRAACGVAFADEDSAACFGHELGHNHGREHAPCDVSPADAAYPYSGGLIGCWGYDNRSGLLQDPSTVTDLMGYCDPRWVSDYTYQALLVHVATVNGAAPLAITAPEAVQQWRVMLVEGTESRWGIPFDEPAPPTGTPIDARIYDAANNPIALVTAYLVPMSLKGARTVLVPEPQADWAKIEIDGVPPLAFP